MTISAVATMTNDALRAEFVDLAGQLVAIENRRAEINTEMQRRERTAKAVSQINNLSQDEVDALRDLLGTKANPNVTVGSDGLVQIAKTDLMA